MPSHRLLLVCVLAGLIFEGLAISTEAQTMSATAGPQQTIPYGASRPIPPLSVNRHDVSVHCCGGSFRCGDVSVHGILRRGAGIGRLAALRQGSPALMAAAPADPGVMPAPAAVPDNSSLLLTPNGGADLSARTRWTPTPTSNAR